MSTVNQTPAGAPEAPDAEVIVLRPPLGPSSPWPAQPTVSTGEVVPADPLSVDRNDPLYDSEVARFHTHVAPTVVSDHAGGIDKAEEAINPPRVAETANRDRLDAATAATLHALRNEHKARKVHEWAEDHPDTCETRRVSGGPLVVISIVVAIVLFLIDRILLRRAFFLDSVGTVTAFAAVIGGIQATSAHMAGKHQKHLKFRPADRRDREAGTHKIWRDAAAVVGIGGEVLLGILRAEGSGQIVTSVLLVAGGLTMWVLIASLSWAHACHTADRLAKAKRTTHSANRRRLRRRKDQAASSKALATAQTTYIGRVRDAVADYGSEVRSLNGHLVTSGKRPIVPEMPDKVRAWSELATSTTLPSHLVLPPYTVPDIPPIAYFVDPFTVTDGVPALGTGDGR